jgi:hypothetical protein
MVPSICQKRIQQRMSLGKNFSTWTGPFRHARPYKPKHKALCQKGLGAYCFFEVNPSIVNAHAFEAVHTGQQTALPLD